MIICIALILFGTVLIYYALRSTDCDECWKRPRWRRKREDVIAARAGVGIVVVGCLLVCYQFAYWG